MDSLLTHVNPLKTIMRVDTDSNYSFKLMTMILSKKNQDDRAIY
jgi:hypothetical protein